MTLPQPLTPPDCDLRSLPSMLLDVVRLRDSDLAQELNAEVFRCGILAWAASWHQVPAASLPDDDKQLAYLLGYGRNLKAFQKVRSQGGMSEWIKCSDGRLYHPMIARKAVEAMKNKEAQRQRTEAARLAKLAESTKKNARNVYQPIDSIDRKMSVTDNMRSDVTVSNIREGKVIEGKRKKESLSTESVEISPAQTQSDERFLVSSPAKDVTAEAVEIWNDICGDDCGRVIKITDQRRRVMKTRMKQDFADDIGRWRAFCCKVAASPLLTGKKGDWRANFDWVLEPKHTTKILEGAYDPRLTVVENTPRISQLSGNW